MNNTGALSSGKQLKLTYLNEKVHGSDLLLKSSFALAVMLYKNIESYRRHPRARGAIYWQGDDANPLPCIELVRRITDLDAELTAPWLAKLNTIPSASCAKVIEDVDGDWMSNTAKTFALKLIEANRMELMSCMKS